MKIPRLRLILTLLLVFGAAGFAFFRLKVVRTPVQVHIVGSGDLAVEAPCTGTLEARVKTTISARIQEHLDAGADQVALQVVPKSGAMLTSEDEKILELLAPQFTTDDRDR
mgnify:CR=1 FL=1